MLWIVLTIMLLAALASYAIPLYWREKRFSPSVLIGIIVVVATAPLVYFLLGTPSSISSQDDAAYIDDMIGSLTTRLKAKPDDLDGWKMLGESYFELERFEESAEAFAKAVELESSGNGQTLADLGQAIIMFDPDSINDQAGQLFESALVLSPTNAKALFYGGLAAIDRGQPELGADRWEKMLDTSPPPPHVEEMLRARIAVLRGETPPPPAPVEAASSPPLNVRVELSDSARAAVREDATVFVIARDPNQPSPPIAAVRRRVAELPAEITLSDSDAMIPGRVPSAFEELEIVARVSMSGNPISQSGDWFGSKRIGREDGTVVNIRIEQQVP